MSELTALIIEDDSGIAFIYQEALQLAGYKTEILENGRFALQHLTHNTPNFILLDLHLPEVSGAEILEFIQERPQFSDTIVFLTTADHVQAEQLRARVDLVLLKPISFIQLRDMALRFRP
jgi:CheY-like chemotaxis protein